MGGLRLVPDQRALDDGFCPGTGWFVMRVFLYLSQTVTKQGRLSYDE